MNSNQHPNKSIQPWNRGKLVGQKAPLKLKEIWGIRIRLQLTCQIRDLALFNLAIDSKLRGCDLVNLLVADVAQGSDGSCDCHAEKTTPAWYLGVEVDDALEIAEQTEA